MALNIYLSIIILNVNSLNGPTKRHSVAEWKRKKAGVIVLTPDKIDFRTKAIVRDKEGHYIMVKEKSNKRIYPQ